jgi:hypothetical protein
MQELLGRITALDPEASAALKVVAYFDALVSSGVGVDALLRAAAAMSGAVAGAERRGRTSRFDPTGRRPISDVTVRAPERRGGHAHVWLERDGALHANDAMIVERLALAVDLLEARRDGDSSLDVVLDPAVSLAERREALARLHINADRRLRVVATSLADPAPGARSTVASTRFGLLRATVDTDGAAPQTGRAGLGTWTRADHAPESWEAAVIAHRLTSARDRVVDATDLGALLLLARIHDPDRPHPDVVTLATLDARSADVLRALVENDSIRAASVALGMHHSSVQSRHEVLTRELGYDPRSPAGRLRYAAAAMLLRLAHPLSE